MPKHGKKYNEAEKKVDSEKLYAPDEGVSLLKEVSFAQFDETIEVHARLGIDPRQADQTVRATVVLPHGTGKTVRVLVFAAGEAERIALASGADYAGTDDLVQQIQDGWLEFDAAVAMADQMGKVGGLGRILGRRGLMPNPRSGTVVRDVADLPGVLTELKGGRVEFRNDRTGIVHIGIGRKSFTENQIRDNLFAFIDALQRAKPTGAKGIYLRTLTIKSTMSPGIHLDVPVTTEAAAAASA
ncbi:MAG: 50S ribosomal protein L1 [Chloroflexota bacterium]|nr:50S ribosomal protein L1 [Chloroflexota bacterium]MDQ3225346.1 50S ribosomal protein L1 [Chloroflexota bacterium]